MLTYHMSSIPSEIHMYRHKILKNWWIMVEYGGSKTAQFSTQNMSQIKEKNDIF